MMRGFYNGISGIKTQSFGMDVWANNISNINNVGFKASIPEFKNSLVNMGFTELEMNFSDQNQRQDKKEQAKNKYSSNQSDESENTQAEQSLLELVIPRYI